MAVILPCRTDINHYDMQVVLDGVAYTLEFHWSYREESWFLDVKTEAGDPIYVGQKVVIDWGLGRGRCRDPRFPPGLIIAVDSTSRDENPGLNDLGGRVQLLYYPAAELPRASVSAFQAENA